MKVEVIFTSGRRIAGDVDGELTGPAWLEVVNGRDQWMTITWRTGGFSTFLSGSVECIHYTPEAVVK